MSCYYHKSDFIETLKEEQSVSTYHTYGNLHLIYHGSHLLHHIPIGVECSDHYYKEILSHHMSVELEKKLENSLLHSFYWKCAKSTQLELLQNSLYTSWKVPRLFKKKTNSDSNVQKRWCGWHNDYRLQKWTLWAKFTSCRRLFAFYSILMLLGKAWILLFSSQLWVK